MTGSIRNFCIYKFWECENWLRIFFFPLALKPGLIRTLICWLYLHYKSAIPAQNWLHFTRLARYHSNVSIQWAFVPLLIGTGGRDHLSLKYWNYLALFALKLLQETIYVKHSVVVFKKPLGSCSSLFNNCKMFYSWNK